MDAFIVLIVFVPIMVVALRWGKALDQKAKPPYSFFRRNALYFLAGFFVLLFGAMFVSNSFSSTYTQAGIGHYKQGAYSVAAGELQKAETLDAHNAEAPYYLGLCLRQEGQPAQALKAFEAVRTAIEDRRYKGSSAQERWIEQEADAQIQQLHDGH